MLDSMRFSVRSSLLFSAFLACAIEALGCGSGDGGGSGGSGGASLAALPVPQQTYSHGEPSGLEQQLLEEVQWARADPPAAGRRIVELLEAQGAIHQFAVDKAQVVADFEGYAPVPPLAFDPHLMASSLVHSNDMADNGFQEHDGSKGEDFAERITDAGYAWSFISENIFAYASSVPQCNAAFLIDWGNPDLGHRRALLDMDGDKRDIGISIVERPNGPNDVGPLVVTQDFGMPASDPRRYIVGVVYDDDNGNGLYDAGEGIEGVRVVPDVGDTYAITSKSGGYAIPMSPRAGDVRVQVQAGSGDALDETLVSLDGANVKADFALKH